MLLHDRQRQALREFRTAAAQRAMRERDVALRFRDGNAANERDAKASEHRIEEEFRTARSAVDQQSEDTRQRMEAHYDQERSRIQTEASHKKRTAIQTFVQIKADTEAEFKDARWTILTLLEADRKVARNHLTDIQQATKETVKKLSANVEAARERLRRWRLEEGAPPPPATTPSVDAEDPHNGLDARREGSDACLAQLHNLGLPGFIKGTLPWLTLFLVWAVTCLPALLLDWWYWWLLGATALVLPIGWGVIVWLRREARRTVWGLYHTILQALVDGRALRKRWLLDAREDYRLQRRLSRERSQRSLREAARKAKDKISASRRSRQETLEHLRQTYPPLLEQITLKRARDQATLEEKAKAGIFDIEDRHRTELTAVSETFKKRQVELNRLHAREWTELAAWWKSACDRFEGEMQAISAEANRYFPAWNDVERPDWSPPTALPRGLQYGHVDLKLADIPNALPEDPHLAHPNLEGVRIPALLPFPQRASMLFMARDDGREEAIDAMEAVLLRCWTALPPGKARCTIIDPVGRGENFAAFMHLADHDESLVTGRIWTEPAQIEQRLADITTHMETVLQKYLRNQFETLADYNEQAGEVAEPFRFLVVAHFPVNFTTDAARRLISIASAGARCGVYTFILADLRQPLPHGIHLEDIENACLDFLWRPPRFLMPDEDFGVFPLDIDTPPAPETCTAILKRVGDAAQKALRVEVPFARLLPPPDEWWRGDSRHGLNVPLGRAGATGLQWLNLGAGTSQHVLVGGKTGSGKSTLLHVLIVQLAMRYSADEVELYLIDFKKGVEFKAYAAHGLPHARVIAIESEREFGLSVLQKLDSELARRGDLFRAAGVSDLAGYRKTAAPEAPRLPRIFLIVDEFQEFFVEDDKVAQEAALLLDRLVRQGRAFGMHVLLGSQTLGGAYSLARSTIDQMAVRIALQCSETDAHLILSKDNTEARLLSRPGEGIYNASGGALEANHLFQVAWLPDNLRDDLIRQVAARDGTTRPAPIVFEGNAAADLARNPQLQSWLSNHQEPPDWVVSAWLGDAVAIKEPTAAVFRRQSGANLVLLGQQDRAAGAILLSMLVGLGAQLRRANGIEKSIHVVLGHSVDPEWDSEMALVGQRGPVRLVGVRELPTLLGQLAEECDRRQAGHAGPPRFLVLFGLHRLRDLRRDDNDFGFSSRTDQPPTPHRQFLHVIREGPAVGIHTIVWCDNLANLQRSVERSDLREFEMRVCFQMSATDSSSLLDSPAAAKLGPYRALFFAEDQGKLEKFRPYGLPHPDWLREAIAQ